MYDEVILEQSRFPSFLTDIYCARHGALLLEIIPCFFAVCVVSTNFAITDIIATTSTLLILLSLLLTFRCMKMVSHGL